MLNFFRVLGFTLSLETVILGHATALISIVVTQVYARLQRINRRIEEASSDLGAKPWQTFLYVTLPSIRTALFGSGLICFTLSFDEIPMFRNNSSKTTKYFHVERSNHFTTHL